MLGATQATCSRGRLHVLLLLLASSLRGAAALDAHSPKCWSSERAGTAARIRSAGALTNKRKSYLSTSSDGTGLDLREARSEVIHDWTFEHLGGNVVHIKAANIKERAGHRRKWQYLSSNNDGTLVDLWKESGGNQRWVITDLGSSATIQVDKSQASPKERSYLSTSADGNTVDLWTEAGENQHWSIECEEGWNMGSFLGILAAASAALLYFCMYRMTSGS